MACDRCNCYFSFWAIFCPFTKRQNFETPGDIIILQMCTKNYDQMMYGSGDMVRDRRTDKQSQVKYISIKLKKTLWPIFIDGVQLYQGYRATRGFFTKSL